LHEELGGNFKCNLGDNIGPWKEEYDKSVKNKTFKHSNQDMVD